MKKVDLEKQVLVHCGPCRTRFHRSRDEVGKVEVCGICHNEAALIEGEPAGKKKAARKPSATKYEQTRKSKKGR